MVTVFFSHPLSVIWAGSLEVGREGSLKGERSDYETLSPHHRSSIVRVLLEVGPEQRFSGSVKPLK